MPYTTQPSQATSTTIRSGYQDHEFYPDNWQITTLGELGRLLSGGTPLTSAARFWDGDIPWISAKDMKIPRLRDSIDHVTPLALGNGTRVVQPGTILMVVRGMSLVHSFPLAIVEKSVAFNQDIKAFVPHQGVSSEFIYRWLEANQANVLSLATDSTHGTKRIPTADLLQSQVPLPSPAEQLTIAEALSDMDGLLGALEELIAKKRATKHATMQQLLIGEKRLPGFSGKWETKSLKEFGNFSKGRGIKRTDISDEGVLCIRYGELYTRYKDHISNPVARISQDVAQGSLPIKKGDLLFAGSGETAEEIGTCAAYLGDEPAYAGGDIIILTRWGRVQSTSVP